MSMTMEHTRVRQQFHCEHSRTGPCLEVGRFFVYPDGGRMEKGIHGATIDPPTDKYELALMQVQYWQAAVEMAAEQFAQLKDSLDRCVYACSISGDPAPPDSEFENLKKAKQLFREYQTKLAGYEARAERYLPVAIKQRRNASVAVRADLEEFATKLGKMKL